MDLRTQLRLAVSLPFPILVGKVTDMFKKRGRRRRLRDWASSGATSAATPATWSLRSGLMPLPSAGWRVDFQERLLVYVRQYLVHEFDVLGSGPFTSVDEQAKRSELLDVSYQPLNWSYDPLSGHQWPRGQWYEQYGPTSNSEIKQPLEFGRVHHLPQLALAAVLEPTLSSSAVREVRNELIDFVMQNPPFYGIQWCSGIDVGIRAFNMCVAWDWLTANGLSPADVEQALCASLVDHAVYLHETLEWSGGMRTSHYLANLLGLLAIGSYLDGHPSALTWRSFAIAELEREIDVQFLPDGSGFEASTCYHRHTADIIEQATMLMGNDASEHWLRRREQIMDVLDLITDDEEVRPMIGDNDDGLALKLVGYEPIPHRHTPQNLRSSAEYVRTLDMGLSIYSKAAYTCELRCGGIGQHGKGGHAHNDQLSLTLSIHGIPFFVDPGIPSYTRSAEERNAFRSTGMHNTLVPKGMEQNAWPKDGGEGLFWMFRDRARATIVEQSERVWVGQHVGFGMPHRRTILFEEDAILGTDAWISSQAAEVRFHCHPSVRITQTDGAVWLEHGSVGLELSWRDASLRIDDYECAPSYGTRLLAQCIALRMHGPVCTWTLRSFARS